MGAYVAEHQRDWDELVGVATYSYNIKPHASTGFTPFELVTSVPQSSLLPHIESSGLRQKNTKAQLRDEFMASVAEKCGLARETLASQQLRYKTAYDLHVRELSAELSVGDLVYVRTYVCLKELSHKLIFPAVGPFLVKRLMPGHHTVQLQTPSGAVTVPIDRVRKCTAPADLPQGMRFAEKSPGHFSEIHQDPAEESFEEYVIDRLVSHRVTEDGQMLLRVRWFGYDSHQDTWEPAIGLPAELVRRYARRRRLSAASFGLTDS
jgi:Chromo (CHRromatin Organisation MOdifier) domain